MSTLPFQILGMWLRGLLAVAILAGGIFLFRHRYAGEPIVARTQVHVVRDDARHAVDAPVMRGYRLNLGWDAATLELVAALGLLAWALGGRLIGRGYWRLRLRPGTPRPGPAVRIREAHEADEDPSDERTGEVHMITRPDGSVLRVECYGPPDAPPIVWTHGWGVDSTEWFYAKHYLSRRFRLIVWDLAGLGLSKQPDNHDYRLEKMAADLDAVLALAGDRPALLVGHSIGGMITLTYARDHTAELLARVAGLVLVHTTYTNPVRTTRMAWLYTALEKPVLIPLLYLTIGLWPLVWLMNWMSYWNGSAHRSTHRSSFAGNETKGQLDFAARFQPRARPDVLARGMFGMLAYDATDALPRIPLPTLVVVGDKDDTTTPEAGAFIAEHVPNSQLVTLSPARHMGLIEHHDRFDEVLSEFAEKCHRAEVPR